MLTTFGLRDLEDILATSPDLLRAPYRAAPDRQRTLGAIVDWSLSHLDDDELAALASLSAFDGSFGLSDAAAVTPPSDVGVGPIVRQLVERSLLSVETSSGTAAYRMLWVVKDRVSARFPGQRHDAQRRHAHRFAESLVELDSELRTAGERAAHQRIVDSYPDLRSAHLWAQTHDHLLAGRITRHLHSWAMSRQFADPFRWAQQLIDLSAEPPVSAAASASQARLYAGDVVGAAAIAEHALGSADGLDRLLLLEALGDIALARGELERTMELGDQLAGEAERHGDQHFVVLGRCARALAHGCRGEPDDGRRHLTGLAAAAPTDRGWLAYTRGELASRSDPDHAAIQFRAAVEAADSVHNVFLAGVARVSLSALRAEHGDPRASIIDLLDTIDHWRRRGMHTYLMTSLRNLALLLDRLDLPHELAQLFGAIDAAAHVASYGEEAVRLQDVRARTERSLGHHAFEQLYGTAAAAPFDVIVDQLADEIRQLARSGPSSEPTPA